MMKLKFVEVVALAQLVFNKTSQCGVKACVKLFTLLQYCVCECMYFHPQQLDSIHVTILHKEEGAGLGFSLAGGTDLENKVITVSGPGMGMSEWVAGGQKSCQEGVLCKGTPGHWAGVRTGGVKEGHCDHPSQAVHYGLLSGRYLALSIIRLY